MKGHYLFFKTYRLPELSTSGRETFDIYQDLRG
jgi:hypothetical protein